MMKEQDRVGVSETAGFDGGGDGWDGIVSLLFVDDEELTSRRKLKVEGGRLYASGNRVF